jgi:hypothetical protein
METTIDTPPVRQVPVPAAVRAATTLSRIDYADTFLADVGPIGTRSAEAWARAVLEDAPLPRRSGLLAGWTALGLRLDLGGPDAVLGWPVRQSTPDALLLGTDSLMGIRAELLFTREPDALRFATLVQLDSRAARAAWTGVERVHVPTVLALFGGASERLRRPTVTHRAPSHRAPAQGPRSAPA